MVPIVTASLAASAAIMFCWVPVVKRRPVSPAASAPNTEIAAVLPLTDRLPLAVIARAMVGA